MSSHCSIKRKRNIKQVNYTKYAMRVTHNIMLKYDSVIQLLVQEFTNCDFPYCEFVTTNLPYVSMMDFTSAVTEMYSL